jgi:hypothetical protein
VGDKHGVVPDIVLEIVGIPLDSKPNHSDISVTKNETI